MGWASQYIARLQAGETVQFRPSGNSMQGKIESGQLCTVEPVDPAALKIGDIVLCKVNGRQYLHLVKAIQGRRFQIGNNRGRIQRLGRPEQHLREMHQDRVNPGFGRLAMPWKVVERKIGRAGGVERRTARQRAWDQKYGEGQWAVGYVLDGAFVLQEEALESIYHRSYEAHFAAHPEDLEGLICLARSLRNPHAEATTGVDLQVPAILTYLERHGLRLLGNEVVDIGSWKGQASHALSIRLSPLHIHVVGDPKMTLEQFWQEKKCLAVWVDE